MCYTKYLVACLVLTIFQILAFAHTKPFLGYFIKLNGDTIRCQIDYNDRNINPQSIKVYVNNEKTILGPQDIKGFGITGYGDYLTSTVYYHINQIVGSNLPEEFSNKIDTSLCFLKALARGNYSLFELVLPERPYYFISVNDSSIIELVYRVKQSDTKIEEDQSYKTYLSSLFIKEGIYDEYYQLINTAVYTNAKFNQLINALNRAHSGVTKGKIKSKSVIQLDAYAGAIMNIFPSSNMDLGNEKFKFNPVYTITGGGSLYFVFPNKFNAFSSGISVGYYSYNANTANTGVTKDSTSPYAYFTKWYHSQATMSNSVLMTNLFASYIINPLSSIKYYVKAGISTNFSIRKDIDIHSKIADTTSGILNGSNYVNLIQTDNRALVSIARKFIGLNASFGIKKGHSKLELGYYWIPTQLSETSGYSFKTAKLSLLYYYTILK